MKTHLPCLVLLIWTRCAALDAAEPAKRGVSPQSAAKLNQIVQASSAKESAERARLLQAAAQASFDQLKNERDAFNAAIAKQPEHGQMKQEFDELVQQAKARNASATQKQRDELRNRFNAFAKKYDPVQSRAYALAKIDDNRVRTIITNNFSRYLGRVVVTKRGLGWSVIQEAPDEPPPVAPPASFCFQRPYDTDGTYGSWEQYPSIVPDGSASASKTTGEIDVFVQTALLEEQSANARVGNYVTIPPGTHQVKLTATVDASFSLYAFAAPGGSYSRAHLGVSMSIDGHTPFGSGLQLGFIFSPIVWLAVYEDSDTFTIGLESAAPGGEYMVTASGSADVLGLGGALAWAQVDGLVTQICVEILD
jgi:hypothetical protein